MNFSHLLALMLSFLLLGCGQQDISRAKAQELILKSPDISRYKERLWLVKGAREIGVKQGLWSIDRNGKVLLFAKAATEIKALETYALIPTKPQDVLIEVTGVADAPGKTNIKDVKFNWRYTEVSPVIKRVATDGGEGFALLRLYDDGWRIEHLKLQYSDKPFVLSESEKQQIQEDIATAAQNLREIQEYFASSWKPTKTVRIFEFPGVTVAGATYSPQRIEITDVDVSYLQIDGKQERIWFGEMKNFSVGFGGSIMLRDPRAPVYIPGRPNMNPEEVIRALTPALAEWRGKYPDLPVEARQQYQESKQRSR